MNSARRSGSTKKAVAVKGILPPHFRFLLTVLSMLCAFVAVIFFVLLVSLVYLSASSPWYADNEAFNPIEAIIIWLLGVAASALVAYLLALPLWTTAARWAGVIVYALWFLFCLWGFESCISDISTAVFVTFWSIHVLGFVVSFYCGAVGDSSRRRRRSMRARFPPRVRRYGPVRSGGK